MTSDILTFEQTVHAPPSQVYRAFTNATVLRQWFCDAALADPRPGGRLYLWWNDGYYACGEFTNVAKDERLAFTWRGRNDPDATRVEVSLMAEGEEARVAITHSGIGSGEAWAETAQEFKHGWEAALENLQSILLTGQDLRYVRRPMLGILLAEFNPNVAAELGVPVTEAVRLDGVVQGMGAEAAGLQKDDVIVAIAGQEVTNYPSLSTALSSHHAGDTVDVVFYRGAEKKQARMTLSGRPLPEVPAEPQALAEAVRDINAEIDAELGALLQDISEEEAAYHPAPDAWSAKETLAHLILGERELHSYIVDLINDDLRWSDRFENPTNVPARIQATLHVFPALPALLDELARHRAETLAMLAALPQEFVARKGSYTQLVYGLLETPGYHERTHLEQMREAIAAARADAT